MKRISFKKTLLVLGVLCLLVLLAHLTLFSCNRGGAGCTASSARGASAGDIALKNSTPGASSPAGSSPTRGGSPTPGASTTPNPSASAGVSPTPISTSTPGPPAIPGGSNLLISRNVPAYASSEQYPASQANDASYDTAWRSSGPAWLAYDLSRVSAAHRSKVLLVWYNDDTGTYDHTLIGEEAYNMPQDYTIQVNPGAGGGNPPSGGWVTLVTVTGNHYHSRQHLIDMTGDNWVRINVTAIDGSVQNYDVAINMDVFDVSGGVNDDWIFFGDSITAGAMDHTTVGGVASFAQLINASASGYYPIDESGGIGYLTSSDGAAHITTWLPLFLGKYVGLSYGTNDALGCVDPNTFYQNYLTMVQAVLAAGKIPVIPHIPWGRDSNLQNCIPGLNAKIDALYQAFPQIIRGPDLWAFFQAHQSLISSDNIHPTDTGFGAYRQQWANAMLQAVYGV